MIRSFNKTQTALAALNAFLGLMAIVLTFLFFWGALAFISSAYSLPIEKEMRLWIALGIVILSTSTGLVGYARGSGYSELEDSGFALSFLDSSTGGSHYMGCYGRQVTGPAYLFSQTFLAGPIQIGRCLDRLKSRIPASIELENAMEETLGFARGKKAWHDITEYKGREQAASYLIRVGALEYSGRKGRVRVADSK
ncbi:MAG: hypothetical protein GXP30_12580 [Verrucomicrobia bacterium]|nr:hypothetical protein [Verrucomicrobiota bacterium]